AGDSVLPLLLDRIQDRGMPRRRYAIGYLGKCGYVPALPVLEQILLDDAEKDLYRSDALMAIDAIAPAHAARLRTSYLKRDDELGNVARNRWKLAPKRHYVSALLATAVQ
ncbi:MAG TPA: hypothetical protein PKD61_21190, partial [Polyangiaceae bacterium]|nr:hypothetical protein [Polyangiaceae bacterium]